MPKPEFDPSKPFTEAEKPAFDPDKKFEAVKVEKNPRFTAVESGLLGATQGATFGFGDEVAGGLVAAVDKLKGSDKKFTDLYSQRRDEQRNILKEAQADNPKSFVAGDVGASLATTAVIPGLGIAKGARFLPAVAKSAALGAATGAGLSEGQTAGDVAIDAAKGGAIGGGTQGLLSGAGKAFSALKPDSLREYAGDRALSAAGFMAKDLKKLSPDQQEKIGRSLLDNKIVSVFSSLDDIAEKSGKGKEVAGKLIGQLGEQIDAQVPNAVSLTNVADKLESYASAIPKTVAGKNLAARVSAEADNFRAMGAAGFKEAQDLKNQFNYKFGDSDALINNQDVTNKIRQIINKEMEDTVENLAKKPEHNFNLSDYLAAKEAYGTNKVAEKVATDRAGVLNAQRTVSLTDYIAGAGGLASGGPGAAVALGGLNKIARKYGASVQAVGADKLADGIEAALAKTPDVLKRVSPLLEKAATQGNKALIAVHLSLMNDPQYAQAFNEDQPKQLNAFERRLQNRPQP